MECNPMSAGGHKYIIVAVDYFTKWVEAMPTFNNTARILFWAVAKPERWPPQVLL